MMDYSSVMSADELEAMAGASVGGFIAAVLVVAFFVVMNWRIFAKAGEPGWKSVIPLYNSFILYKIAWGNGWLMFLTFIPLVGFIFPIICAFKLARAFGHGFGYGLGINFLPIVFYPMLAFGKSEYVGPAV
jgi:hypothetical protein